MDLASIGLEIKSDGLRRGVGELDRLKRTGREAERTTKRLETQTGRLNKGFYTLSNTIKTAGAALAVFGVSNAIKSAIREQEQLQRNMLRTEALVKSTGAAAGFTADELYQQSRALAAATLQSTEGVMQAQQILLTFRKVSGETFQEATEMAANLATVTGTDLNSAMTQLGKVLEDPIRNLGQLNRSGVSFTQSQTDMIKQLWEAGEATKAQSVILDVLSDQYAGVARNEAKGLAGSLDTLGQSWQELQQATVDATGAMDSGSEFVDTIAGYLDEMTTTITDNKDDVREFVNTLEDMAEFGAKVAKEIGDATSAVDKFVEKLTGSGLLAFLGKGTATGSVMSIFSELNKMRDDSGVMFPAPDYEEWKRSQEVITEASNTTAQAVVEDNEKIKESDADLFALRMEKMENENAQRIAMQDATMTRLQKERDEVEKTANTYADLMEAIQGVGGTSGGTSAMGDPLAEGISQAVEAMNRLNATYAEEQDNLNDIRELRERINSETVAGTQERQNAIESLNAREQALAEQSLEMQIGGYRELFGTTAQLFEEHSKERKKLHQLEQAFAAVEIALQMRKAVVSATAAIANQGSGDPYTAFGRIAAMGALMAGVLGSAGISFGGGSGGGSAPTADPYSGSVLGSDEASQSANNVLDLLDDIHAKEYRELRGIHTSMESLNRNITGLVSNIALSTKGQGGLEFAETGLEFDFFREWTQKMTDASNEIFQPLLDPIGSVVGDIPIIGEAYDMLGGVLDTVGGWVDDIVGGLFGGKTKTSVVEAGFELGQITIGQLQDGISAAVQQYNRIKIKEDGGLFGSDKTSYRNVYQAVDSSITGMFTNILGNVGDSITAMAGSLGDSEDVQRALNYTFDIGKINLKGLEPDEVEKRLGEMVSFEADKAAETVLEPIISMYQRVDEGLFEASARMMATKEVVTDALAQTGISIEDNVLAIVDNIANLAGGLSDFQEMFDVFYTNFFNDAEKQQRRTENLSGIFEDLNMQLPETREAYKDLVESLDVTTASGQQAYVTLLDLSTMADEYYNHEEELQKERIALANKRFGLEMQILKLTGKESEALALERQQELSAMDASLRPLQERIWALQDEQKELDRIEQQRANAENQLREAYDNQADIITEAYNNSVDSIRERIDNLQDNVSALDSAIKSLTRARREMEETDRGSVLRSIMAVRGMTGEVRSGDYSSLDDLDYHLGILTQDNAGLYESFADYQRDYKKSEAAITDLESTAGDQLTVEQRSLNTLDAQLEQARIMHSAELEALYAQRDAILGVDNSVLTVAQAIANLEFMQQAQREIAPSGGSQREIAPSGGSAGGYVESLYATMLGREADPEGLEFWTQKANVEGPESIIDAFRAAAITHGEIPKFASGGTHQEGWRVVGENGPELEYTGASKIYSNAQSRNMLDTSGLEMQIKALHSDIKAAQFQIARNTGKSAKLLDRWDGDGIPEERVV